VINRRDRRTPEIKRFFLGAAGTTTPFRTGHHDGGVPAGKKRLLKGRSLGARGAATPMYCPVSFGQTLCWVIGWGRIYSRKRSDMDGLRVDSAKSAKLLGFVDNARGLRNSIVIFTPPIHGDLRRFPEQARVTESAGRRYQNSWNLVQKSRAPEVLRGTGYDAAKDFRPATDYLQTFPRTGRQD